MQRAQYQSLDSQAWSTTQMVALVATACLTVGVTAGLAAAPSTPTQLYAPVATVSAQATGVMPAAVPMAPRKAVHRMAAAPVARGAYHPEKFEFGQAPVQQSGVQVGGSSLWAAALMLGAGIVGAVAARLQSISRKTSMMAPLDLAGQPQSLAMMATAARRPVVGGNWKCNPETPQELDSLIANIEACDTSKCDVYVCPSPLHTAYVQGKFTNGALVTPQNCNFTGCGAYTGEMAVEQMKAMGITNVLIGHSERRGEFGIFPMDDNQTLATKLQYILDAGMSCVFCIGEPKEIRERGLNAVLAEMDVQLTPIYHMLDPKKVVIAYEPVWAIGTGLTATPEDAQATHAGIRQLIAQKASPAVADAIRIQYGGSANAANAPQLSAMPDIDGFLVGGASLKPEFADIVAAISEEKGQANVAHIIAGAPWFAQRELTSSGVRPDADRGSPEAANRVLYKHAQTSVGAWSCTEGGFPVNNRPTTEWFYVLEGEGVISDADGMQHPWGPGDTVVLPKGWSGRWDIHKAIRKIFVVNNHPDDLSPSETQRALVAKPEAFAKGQLASYGKRKADWNAPEGFGKDLCELGGTSVGSWACTRGGFAGTPNRPTTEIFYVIEGFFYLTGSDGVARQVKAGDTVILPKGWTGRWDIIEPVHKMYCIVSE